MRPSYARRVAERFQSSPWNAANVTGLCCLAQVDYTVQRGQITCPSGLPHVAGEIQWVATLLRWAARE
jgi:hypothetical protein